MDSVHKGTAHARITTGMMPSATTWRSAMKDICGISMPALVSTTNMKNNTVTM